MAGHLRDAAELGVNRLMHRYVQHSDYANTDLGEPSIRPAKQRVLLMVDHQGYACKAPPGFTYWRAIPEDRDARWQDSKAAEATWGELKPIDPQDISLPPGYVLDADGRAHKELRDADGTLIARLTTDEIILSKPLTSPKHG